MLESQQAQLVMGLQELYKRTQNGQGWLGSPLKETSHGAPLTHDILERLGALKQDGHATGEVFEEDLGAMQQRLIANGAGYMQREASSDGSSDVAQSPMFEQFSQKVPLFTDPFAIHQLPPTPPNNSPYPQSARTVAPTKPQSFSHQRTEQIGMNPALLQRQTWAPSHGGFDDNMDFINRFDAPMSFDIMSPQLQQMQAPLGTINPSMAMRFTDDDFYSDAMI